MLYWYIYGLNLTEGGNIFSLIISLAFINYHIPIHQYDKIG